MFPLRGAWVGQAEIPVPQAPGLLCNAHPLPPLRTPIFWTVCVDGVVQQVAFEVRLPLLSLMFSSSSPW